MKIIKNGNLDNILVLPNECGTNEVYIGFENDFILCLISLTVTEARQMANELLKICNELETENE